MKTLDITRVLSPEDAEFLTGLANELKTQDRDFTARPALYQVLENKKWIGTDPDFSERMCLVLGDDSTEFFENEVAEAKEFLAEYSLEDGERAALTAAKNLKELADFCDRAEIDNCVYTGYEEYEKFSGAFLTRSACERHIQANRHHYEDPKVYTRYAWHNPQLEHLLNIVEKFATVEDEPE